MPSGGVHPIKPVQPQGDDDPPKDRGGGREPLYLPPYLADFNPIENAFAKLKALLRKAAERTVDAIGRMVDLFTPPNAKTTSKPQDTMQHDRLLI